MSFGLIDTPVVFQHLMNDIFREYLDDFVVCYINDIIIFSKNMEVHERHLCLILKKFQEVKLYVKLEKCEFHQSEVHFLGYVIFGDDICMDLHKVQTIIDWATPISIQDVQCIIKFANFYQRFIAHYFSIAALLTLLIRMDQLFSRGVEVENVFQSLKVSFTIASFLIHANLSNPFVLDTDVFDFVVGATLS